VKDNADIVFGVMIL